MCDYTQEPCKTPGKCKDCVVFKQSDKVLKPNMRTKIQEYISELDQEIDRYVSWVEENMSGEACKVTAMESRLETLIEVKNDLQSRLEEVI